MTEIVTTLMDARRCVESMTSSFVMTNISYLIHVQMTNGALARPIG
jgi:hypothetical protein